MNPEHDCNMKTPLQTDDEILTEIQRTLTLLVGKAESIHDTESVKILLRAKTEIHAGWAS